MPPKANKLMKLTKLAKIISLALVLGLGASAALANWTPPPNGPTSCETNPASPNYSPGCALPVNVSSVGQVKGGNFGLGIGAINPLFKFEVSGNTLFTGILNAVNNAADALVVGSVSQSDSGDFVFYNEIKPDGDWCTAGQILRKNADDDWGCANFALEDNYWQLNGPGIINKPAYTDVSITNNLLLPNTSAAGTAGVIKFGGNNFFHNKGTNNLFLGLGAGNASSGASGSGGSDNVGVGAYALSNDALSGSYNIAIGSNAMSNVTTGADNIAIGASSFGTAQNATANIVIGRSSLNNILVGSQSNISIGRNTMQAASSLSNNVAIGEEALRFNKRSGLVAVGHQALKSNTDGQYNTAVGFQSLYNNIGAVFPNGNFNTAYGYQSLFGNTTGYGNTAIGYLASHGTVTDSGSTAVGYTALGYFTGIGNTAVGYQALRGNDFGSLASGANNTAVGFSALGAFGVFTNRDNNTALGKDAGGGITTGDNNTLVGTGAGFSGTPISASSDNTYVGYNAAGAGANNTLVGSGTQGSVDSVAIGKGAIAGVQEAVVIGKGASATVGSNSIALGADSFAGATGAIAIGNGAALGANNINSVVIGTSGTIGSNCADCIILGTSFTKVGIRNNDPQDALQIGVSGGNREYLRLDFTNTAPPSGECTDSTIGRIIYNNVDNRLYICDGSSGSGWILK